MKEDGYNRNHFHHCRYYYLHTSFDDMKKREEGYESNDDDMGQVIQDDHNDHDGSEEVI